MRASRGEIKIQEILEQNDLNFVMEYSFPGLNSTSGRPLRFDFVIFDDDNKIDLVFQNKSCDLNIQLKKTTNVPQYFKIRSESNSEPEKFCLI